MNGSTRRAYRRLAALTDQDVVAAYLVHVAATDGRLTMPQHAVSALRHVARQAGIPDPHTPASRCRTRPRA